MNFFWVGEASGREGGGSLANVHLENYVSFGGGTEFLGASPVAVPASLIHLCVSWCRA